ncbi:hypothetical protein J4866_09440 [Prevotella denticola]|uniref:hypothetical protein n=1 Tax=Prevotella denticola TaxID=28129 RepID=UPI001BAE0B41|nr:hypothetical protein [Prevotella denticola]QUB94303.1 hypothetical protein J4866_09440 [Prevotella denticola]
MMKQYLGIYILFIMSLMSCGSGNDKEMSEVYVCSNFVITNPNNPTVEHRFILNEIVQKTLEPTLEVEDSSVKKDTLKGHMSVTDFMLALRDHNAMLEVKTKTTMTAREVHERRIYYVFKAGVYEYGRYEKFVVKHDGIYWFSNGDKILPLENFRLNHFFTIVVLSSHDFIKETTMIARGEVIGKDFVVSNRDATYRCQRISDKEIRLDIVSPEQLKGVILSKE